MNDLDNEFDDEDVNPQTEHKQNLAVEDHGDGEEFFFYAYSTLRDTLREVYGLKAREDHVLKDKERIHAEIQEAKNFIEKKPQYQNYLQNLQKALYEQNINVFNQLLTYFVRDVLKTDKAIEMELFVSRNMPGISIEAVNGGFKENIIDGSGGAIANIVSTGLRLICLSRLPHRKFIILDEPDCWIKPEFVPAFAKIIGELSKKLRIQTIIISHHNWEFFKDYGRVIELDKDGSILENHIKHDTAFDESQVTHDYITEISLRKFMSHYNTTYKLHPYLTCIIGKNDLGKSVVAPAMKAISFNESSDSCVMHNENSAEVFVRTSKGDGFMWERFKVLGKGQEQKVRYSLYKDDDLITSEFNSKFTPDFINDKLKIMRSEDVDVHISSQKTPIFMIGNDVSAANKAKILSLGKEIIIIQQMMAHIQKKASEYSSQNKKNEPLYTQYIKELKLLNGIEEQILEIEKIQLDIDKLKADFNETEELKNKIEELKVLKSLSDISLIKEDLKTPILEDEEDINEMLWRLDIGKKYSTLSNIEVIPLLTKFEETEDLLDIIKRLRKLSQFNNLSSIDTIKAPTLEPEEELNDILYRLDLGIAYSKIKTIEPIETIKLEDEDELNNLLFKINEHKEFLENKDIELTQLSKKKIALDEEKKKLEDKLREEYEKTGNICPTCKQVVSFEIYKEHLA